MRHGNECEEGKHEHNNFFANWLGSSLKTNEHNNDDDDGDDEGQWEGVADVRATSGATWLTLPRSVGGLDVGLRL